MSAEEALIEALRVPVVIMHPPEAVVKTSMLVVLGGFFLLFAVIILATFSWAAHGERDGKPDVFGKRVTVREVAERYKAAWTPGKFWPRDAFSTPRRRPRARRSSRSCGPS